MSEVACWPALSIRQPWAWLIAHGGKDIENRCWPTKRRGRINLHVAQGMTKAEYAEARAFYESLMGNRPKMPEFKDLQRGGLFATAELVDCVTRHTSSWFMGPYGFVLRDVRVQPFIPMKGALGFFNPDALLIKK